MRRRAISRLALAALAILAAGESVAQDKLNVSVPQRGVWDTGIAELGQRAGIFKKHGLVLELLFTEGGAESQQAVIAGSMDIAVGVGVGSVLSAFAKGAPVRVFSGEMIGSPNQYWFVPAASPIQKIADLAGKTVAYSVTGSSSHTALLELLAQYRVAAKPVPTGGIPSTLTATMTGQIDVGWGSAPYGLDLLQQGKIRVIARGTDVAVLSGRTVRVNITNLDMLSRRKDAIERFLRAYRETFDWMYADPAALDAYAGYARLPVSQVADIRNFVPREAVSPDRIAGIEEVVADAVRLRFLSAPLTRAQIDELLRLPVPAR
jgi:NitT/TauT family transport system substrate-binding protein